MPKPPTAPFDLLIACVATALAAEASGGGVEVWLQLMPAGRVHGRDGRGPFIAGDEVAMKRIVAATETRAGSTEIVIDYDHQTVFSAVPGVGGRAPAAGWIRELQVRPDGIWGRVRWTEAAAAAIKAEEYRYLSPVFLHDKSGAVRCLLSAALTNTPNFDLAGAVAARALPPETDGEPMKGVAKALGLSEDATEEQILVAVAAVLADRATLAEVAEAAGKTGASGGDIVAAVQSAVSTRVDPAKYVPIDQHVAVQTQLAALQRDTATARATAAVEAAMVAGKVAPASKDWATSYAAQDPAGFAGFVASAPTIVDPAGRGAARGDPAKPGTLDDGELAVCRTLGITVEEFLKAKGETR